MNIWEQQKNIIEYVRSKGMPVENKPFMYNYVPAVEIQKRNFVVLCDRLFKFGSGTVGYLSREIAPDEMDEIIYLGRAYIRDGIHSISDVINCADANNMDEVLFDREITDLWEGRIPEEKSVLEYRRVYLAEKGIEWHGISDEMRRRLYQLQR